MELVDPTTPHTPTPTPLGQGQGQGPEPPALPAFETHVLAASSESLFVWSLHEGAVVQQADAPGTSGSKITQGAGGGVAACARGRGNRGGKGWGATCVARGTGLHGIMRW